MRRRRLWLGSAIAFAAGGIAACAVGYSGTPDGGTKGGPNPDAAIRHPDGGTASDAGTISEGGSDAGFTPTVSGTLAGGSYSFTSFTIPAGVTITVTGGDPLDVDVSGPVEIDGTLAADGIASQLYLADGGVAGAVGAGVAGGSAGGDCGVRTATAGMGPGGGGGGTASASSGWGNGGGGAGFGTVGAAGTKGADESTYADSVPGTAGAMYGNAMLVAADGGALLLGGSGGGGGGSYEYCNAVGTNANTSSSAGGGGGGAIRISSSASITIGAAGLVSANGGASAPTIYPAGTGGGGSGGTIWLRAPTLAIDGSISARGGVGGIPGNKTTPPAGATDGGLPPGGQGGTGSVGRIRLDSTTKTGAGTITPAAGYTGTYP